MYIYIYKTNSWECTQSIPHKPVKKESKSLAICQHVFCRMQQTEDSKANVSLHKEVCQIHISPPQGITAHIQRGCHSAICPQLLPSQPHTIAKPLLQQWHWHCVHGAPEVCSQTEDWDHSWQERKNMHPSRPKYYHCDVVRLSASQMDRAWRIEGLAQAIKREAKYKWVYFRKYTAPKED